MKDKNSSTPPPIYGTYMEAREEANRLRLQNKDEGILAVRIEKAPYGHGFVIRHVPVDPELCPAVLLGKGLSYQDVRE